METAVKSPRMHDAQKTQLSKVDTCWHVPVIAALAMIPASIGFENSGFFYVGFVEEFHSSRAAAVWPGTLGSITADFSGMSYTFCNIIISHWFSVFKIANIASCVTWVGMIASAFAPSIPWMAVTFGVIYGIGLGTFTISLGIIVMMFFDKYRGIAHGIKFAGFSLSSLLFAQILVLMQETYAFRGTLL
ncbi:unnamed protein product, partial [Ixodes hexagonus]